MYISPKIELRETIEMGKGFFAKENIDIGEEIMKINSDKIISFKRLEEFYEFNELLYQKNVSNKSIFAYFLSAVKATKQLKKQQFKDIVDYFTLLPEKISCLLCWENQQLSLIQNKELIKRIQEKKQKITQQYQLIVQNIKKLVQKSQKSWQWRLFSQKQLRSQQIQRISLQVFIYFYSVIQSRSVDDRAYENVGAMAPQLEFFNHSNNPHCKVKQNEGCIVKIIKPIQKDEQIFVSYGFYEDNNDEKFLEFYGFIPSLTKILEPTHNYRKNLAKEYNEIYLKNTS